MASNKFACRLVGNVKEFFGVGKKKEEEETAQYDCEADHERDTVRTFIISHREQSAEARKFKDALIRARETELRTKEAILAKCSHAANAQENTNKIFEYFNNVTGVLFLCSEELVKLLDDPSSQQTQIDLQVSGDDVYIDAQMLSSGIEESDIIKKKVILIKRPEYGLSVPKCFANKKPLNLTKENLDRSDPNKMLHDIWVRDFVISNLKQLSQRLISQTSIGN